MSEPREANVATVEQVVRQRLAEAFGGVRGIVEAAVPTITFTLCYLTTRELRMSLIVASALTAVGRPPAWPVEANLVFLVLPNPVEARMRRAGAHYYVRHSESLAAPLPPDHCLIRLVTSFATREDEVERFASLAAKP